MARKQKLLRYFLLLIFLPGCETACPECRANLFANISNFDVNPTHTSGLGIKVDGAIDLDALDKRVEAITKCIAEQEADAEDGWNCLYKRPTYSLDCLTIKVVAPVYSKCSTWEFIGIPAPDELCEAKGLTPTSECKCLWRQAIQDDWTIITPPEPALYLWDVGRALTSCNNIWKSVYAKCLMF